jgi:cytochrome c oxidase subunit 1
VLNLRWVPGHGHLMVGIAVTLTFMGITHWLVPHLSRLACGTGTWPWLVVVGLFILLAYGPSLAELAGRSFCRVVSISALLQASSKL